jgi:predicted dehydrogenase
MARRIRWGMVGGGEGAFIGEAHRRAARLDDRFDLVAGCLSATPDKALRSAAAIGLAPERSYASPQAMAEAEAARADGIEAVTIVTPNDSHAALARLFLERGVHVVCDKPLTTGLAQSRALAALAESRGLLLGVTYNYTGYPLIRHARRLIAEGAIGRPRIVRGEFALGWMATPVEREGAKQAEWRTDPARSGPSFIIADLGGHVANLAEFVAGDRIVRVAADAATMVEGRRLEDDARIGLAFERGARGEIWVSAVAAGEHVGLRLRVYGETGMLGWDQSAPDEMRLHRLDGSREILTRGSVKSPEAKAATRLVSGLPEGYLEAFGNLYSDYAERIMAIAEQRPPAELSLLAPAAREGVAADAFIEASRASQAIGGGWTRVEPPVPA